MFNDQYEKFCRHHVTDDMDEDDCRDNMWEKCGHCKPVNTFILASTEDVTEVCTKANHYERRKQLRKNISSWSFIWWFADWSQIDTEPNCEYTGNTMEKMILLCCTMLCMWGRPSILKSQCIPPALLDRAILSSDVIGTCMANTDVYL